MSNIEIQEKSDMGVVNPLADSNRQCHIQQISEYHLFYIHERCITEHARISMENAESDKAYCQIQHNSMPCTFPSKFKFPSRGKHPKHK